MSTNSQFNGIGQYTGSIDTIAPYLTTDTTPNQFLYTSLLQRVNVVLPSANLDAFFNQFSQSRPLPQNIDDFAEQFAQFYNLSITFGSLAAAKAQIKADIINSSQAAIQTNNTGFAGGPHDADYDPLINPIGTQVPPGASTINQDIATRSFNDFLKSYKYSFQDPINSNEFQTNWGNYYITIANVRNDYRYVFEAFFANGTQPDGYTDFEHTLSAFVKNIMYPASGSDAAFLPGQNYSEWFVKIQQEFAKSLYGAGAPVQTSITPSVEKARILDIILQLIIKMIGTLQVVTASQSDRLTFLTSWQTAYTNLEGQIRSFVKNGPEWIQGNDSRRNDLNQVNQTYTEEVRSRRTVVSDDAKALQTNINQSSDTANQQTSLATAIIQEFSTILSAVFR